MRYWQRSEKLQTNERIENTIDAVGTALEVSTKNLQNLSKSAKQGNPSFGQRGDTLCSGKNISPSQFLTRAPWTCLRQEKAGVCGFKKTRWLIEPHDGTIVS